MLYLFLSGTLGWVQDVTVWKDALLDISAGWKLAQSSR